MPEQVRPREQKVNPSAEAPDPPVEPIWKELLELLPALGMLLLVTLLGAAIAVGAGLGLDALAGWAMGPCVSTAPEVAALTTASHYLRFGALAMAGAGLALGVLLSVCTSPNEKMHHTLMLTLKGGVAGLLLAAAAGPLVGAIGCAAL